LLHLVEQELINWRLQGHMHAHGERKWQKEFRQFAQTTPVSMPWIDGLLRDGSIIRWHGCDVRELLPLMLQADAAEYREEHAGGQRMPRHFRSIEGCEHAIMKKTGAAMEDVRHFMEMWYDANEEILQLVYEAIAREPVQNYFR
jgi:hypothetical protein